MYSKIPLEWRAFDHNVTLVELNDLLVQLHIPTIIFISILMVIGVFGNLLVLCIYTKKYASSTHRCFILSLAWIDLIACCVGMPLLIVSMLHPYEFPSEEACKTLRFMHVFLVVSSAFVVMAIAIERHRRICFSFRMEMSIRKIKLMCLVACVLGLITAIPAIIVFGDAPVYTGVNNITGIECYVDPALGDSKLPFGYFLFQLLITIVAMIILGVFYVRIGRKIWWHHNFIRENTYCSTTPAKKSFQTETSVYDKNNCQNAAFESPNDAESKDENKNEPDSREGSPAKASNDSADNQKNNIFKLKFETDRRDSERSQSPSRTGGSIGNQTNNGHRSSSVHGLKKKDERSYGPTLRTRQVTLMLFIITMVFILSFIPHLILMVFLSVQPDFLDDLSPAGVAVYNVFLRSFVINNMANPIIYGFCDKKFRKECVDFFVKIVFCGRR